MKIWESSFYGTSILEAARRVSQNQIDTARSFWVFETGLLFDNIFQMVSA